MAYGNVMQYYPTIMSPLRGLWKCDVILSYHNFTTTWFCVKHIFKKAQYGRNYGRKGINTQSKKPQRGEIMVDKKSVPQNVKRLSNKKLKITLPLSAIL